MLILNYLLYVLFIKFCPSDKQNICRFISYVNCRIGQIRYLHYSQPSFWMVMFEKIIHMYPYLIDYYIWGTSSFNRHSAWSTMNLIFYFLLLTVAHSAIAITNQPESSVVAAALKKTKQGRALHEASIKCNNGTYPKGSQLNNWTRKRAN